MRVANNGYEGASARAPYEGASARAACLSQPAGPEAGKTKGDLRRRSALIRGGAAAQVAGGIWIEVQAAAGARAGAHGAARRLASRPHGALSKTLRFGFLIKKREAVG